MNYNRLKLKRTEALNLYLRGKSRDEIARRFKVSDRTIDRWARIGKWKQTLDEINQKAVEGISMDVAKEKERTLKLIKATEAKYAEQLQNNLIEVNAGNFAQLQRVKWEILMPKTISQYNFMKKEQNVVLTSEEINKLMEVL